jgi:hypothetical protein
MISERPGVDIFVLLKWNVKPFAEDLPDISLVKFNEIYSRDLKDDKNVTDDGRQRMVTDA